MGDRMKHEMIGTENYYEEHGEEFAESTKDVNLASVYEAFLPHVPRGGKILDAGCGSGRDSLHFLRAGYAVTALDATETLARYASRLTGLPVLRMRFQEMEFVEEFDGIWTCASLLHVPKREMPEVMGWCVRALKPGGVWYMSFKPGDEEGVNSEGRLFNCYTEETLAENLRAFMELDIQQIWSNIDHRPGRNDLWWVNAVVRKGGR